MKTVRRLIKLLSQNYYKDYLIKPHSENVDFDNQILLVEYESKNFYEINLELIEAKQRATLEEVQNLYKSALAEIFIEISRIEPKKFEIFLSMNIRALETILLQLRNDFYIDDSQSRYFSILLDNENVQNIDVRRDSDISEEFASLELSIIVEKLKQKITATHPSSLSWYATEYLARRFKTISYLPYRLFILAHKFTQELYDARNSLLELNGKKGSQKLKWSGKGGHIGFIFGTLAQHGFIEPPRLTNGEINFAEFARIILENLDANISEESLRKYLNPVDKKFQESQSKFESLDFNFPNSKLV